MTRIAVRYILATMRNRASLSIAPLAICLAMPAYAQADPEPDSSNAITVEGKRQTIDRQVKEMAKSIGERPRAGKPLAKFYGELCMAVYGLRRDVALDFIDRVNANAQQLGIKVGGKGCTVNSFVGFARDSRSALGELKRSHSWLFDQLYRYEQKRIGLGSGAVQAWHITEEVGENGRAMGVGRDDAMREFKVNTGYRATRQGQAIRIELSGSIVLIDNRVVPGKTVQQLADYASMRIFASIRDLDEAPAGSVDTILSLFADDAPPPGLTTFDRAYLNGLYRLPESAQSGAIGDATRAAFWRERDQPQADGQ
ncbi:hypothetical protein [Sphingomonas jaspsi]|uniref:hypothetical protein n=1 Tax=Sphingomonas jaspsi TaxID=392409 RepID=UPI0004ACF571|nr:hypothetical protein [Sphingomonas jaspsi]